MSIAIDIDRERIAEFALFGSVTGEDFGEESDVDVLLTFEDEVTWGFSLVELREELSEIFGREVDFLSRRALEHSRNPLRKKYILESVEVVYP